jgi:hypothetical protein
MLDMPIASQGDHMLSTLSRHVRHNVVGYLALFAALGGTSYAAAQLPSGSVGTPQLRNAAVTAANVAAPGLVVEMNSPDLGANSWELRVDNPSSSISLQAFVQAVCAS